MKISKICALALAGALCSEAMAEGAFVGIESDYAFKTKLKLIGEGDAKDAQPALGLKFGYDLDNFRIYTSYMHDFTAKESDSQTSMGVKEDVKLEWEKNSLLLGADFTPPINNYFRFLAGGFIGYTKTKVDLRYLATGAITEIIEGKETFKGFAYGAKLGGILDIDNANSVELGYKVEKTRYDTKNDAKLNDTSHGIFAAYTYKFN